MWIARITDGYVMTATHPTFRRLGDRCFLSLADACVFLSTDDVTDLPDLEVGQCCKVQLIVAAMWRD